MDENTLIGFNMAVAIFNKCFGESGALKNEQSEQNVGMCQQNVGEMSEQTDGDLISCDVVIEWLKGKDIIKLSSQEETARKELKALSSVELQPYIENMPSADGNLISRDFMKKLGATCIATRNEKGELVAISSIDNLPSAEKTAEWIRNGGYYQCSKCFEYVIEDDENCQIRSNFCPNCGAKMKESVEE